MSDVVRYGLVMLVVLFTNFQEGVTGFGCTALALPFVTLLLGLDTARSVLVMLALVLNLSIVLMSWRKIVWKEYIRIVLLAGIGMPFGMWMAQALPEEGLKAVLAVFMVIVGIHGLVKYARKQVPHTEMSPKTRALVSSILPLGGVIHGAFGSGGPFVIIYATKALGDKSVFRVTLSLLWLTLNTILVGRWIASSQISSHDLRLAVWGLPVTVLGLVLGQFAHNRINDLVFRRMVYGVLMAAGAALVWSILR